jgi:hypothetical protein
MVQGDWHTTSPGVAPYLFRCSHEQRLARSIPRGSVMTRLSSAGYRCARTSASGQRRGSRRDDHGLAGDLVALSTNPSLPHALQQCGGADKRLGVTFDELARSPRASFVAIVVRLDGLDELVRVVMAKHLTPDLTPSKAAPPKPVDFWHAQDPRFDRLLAEFGVAVDPRPRARPAPRARSA